MHFRTRVNTCCIRAEPDSIVLGINLSSFARYLEFSNCVAFIYEDITGSDKANRSFVRKRKERQFYN